jgi:hypothetical protein
MIRSRLIKNASRKPSSCRICTGLYENQLFQQLDLVDVDDLPQPDHRAWWWKRLQNPAHEEGAIGESGAASYFDTRV